MICDIGRIGYNRPCQFFADGVGPVMTINWYRAPAGAKVFPFPQRFMSTNWSAWPWELNSPGELWEGPPTWTAGRTPPTVDGQSFCGPADWFVNGADYDPLANYPRDPFGPLVACGQKPDPALATVASGVKISTEAAD